MDIIGELDKIWEALDRDDSDLFAHTLNDILDYYDEVKYDGRRRLWTLRVGGCDTYSPQIERTKYEDVRRYNLDGNYSYENKNKVLVNGADILSAMDKAVQWQCGYSYWDRYTAKSEAVLYIYAVDGGNDNLHCKIKIQTGKNCKEEFFNKLKEHILKNYEDLSLIERSRRNYKNDKYDFDKTVTNYRKWVEKWMPVILKNNGYKQETWYEGLNIEPAGCNFWTGHVDVCSLDGIRFWVGGDSTDDEEKISYSDWGSSKDWSWYSERAEVRARLDADLREEMSKKIYDYIQRLCKDGKLK